MSHVTAKAKSPLIGSWIAISLFSGLASAETLRQVVTNSNPITMDGGAQVISANFVAPVANTRIVITYNAECSVGGGPTNWLNTDIFVDNVIIAPTNSDNALCSGNHTATQNDGWVSAVSMGTTVVSAGAHTVRVRVNDQVAGSSWRIDDQTLVVESQP